VENSIGSEQFLEIVGMPDLAKMRLDLVERPGVDGTGIWETGTRGKPFTLLTRVDAEDLRAAIETFARYCKFPEQDSVDLMVQDVSFLTYGFTFQVLDVRPREICELANSSGGLNPPSLAWCECEWDLVAIPEPTS
jgi:hypothetical protein